MKSASAVLIAVLACSDASAFRGGALPGPSVGRCSSATTFNVLVSGNSIPAGGGYPTYVPAAMRSNGVTVTAYNKAHAGYTTPLLTALITTEVDPYWLNGSNNVLIFQEGVNDLNQGLTTGASAYTHVQQFMAGLSNTWFKIYVMPTPRLDPGKTGTYDAKKADFIALVNADPTFGGLVDAVYRVDNDPVLGCPTCPNDTFWYRDFDATDTKLHWNLSAHSKAASGILEIIEAHYPSMVPYIPAHAPAVALAYTSSDTAFTWTASDVAATNGQNVKTLLNWYPLLSTVQAGNAIQATVGSQPVLSSTGFGGKSALTLTAAKWMAPTNLTLGHGTIIATFKGTASGALLQTDGTIQRRLYVEGAGAAAFTAYEYSTQGAIQSIGRTDDNAVHVLIFSWDGTYAGQRVWLDGVSKTLTPFPGGYNLDAGGTTQPVTTTIFGSGANGITGLVGEVMVLTNPLSDHEAAKLSTSLCALRGYAC